MKVIHFQRKPVSSVYFSIENYFESVRKELPKEVQTRVVICPYISQGLFNRVRNAIQAGFQEADIFHITGDVHYLTLLLSKKKTLLTIHDCVFMQHPSPLARRILKLFWLTLPAKKAAFITCISEKTKEEVLQHISYDPHKIIVIPTVVNEHLFVASPKEFPKTCPTILIIGTTPNKNIERVAQALEGLGCKVEIIGLLSEDQKVSLSKHKIDYHNEVGISNERVAQKYRESDLLLFASTYEGFGMPILEAQLTGRPVITSNLSPMKEVAGESALLIDPFDVKSIRQGVIQVIEDASLRTHLIEEGFKNTKRFTAKKIAEQYASLYKKMLGLI